MKNLSIVCFILFLLFTIQIRAAGNIQILTAVSIEGNENIAEEEILSYIESIPGEIFDGEKIKEDIEQIYDSGYFLDITVSLEYYSGGLKAVFEVKEYPVLQDIILERNSIYSTEELISLMELEYGQILNINKLIKARNSIIEKYHNDGYILATYSKINLSDEGILTLHLDEGTINEVIITGNEKTKDHVIKRELEFNTGDIFNKKKIEKSIYNLYQLNYFKEVKPRLERVGDTNQADIIIDVVEDETRKWIGGVTYHSKEGLIGYTGIDWKNFLGKGQDLYFNWEFGNVDNYYFSFSEPYFMGRDNDINIGFYDKNKDGSGSKGDFIEKRNGGSITFGSRISEYWRSNLRVKIEDTSIVWVDDKNKLEPVILEKEEEVLRSLTLQFSKNTFNHPVIPTKGGRDMYSIEYAGQLLGGTTNFTKYRVNFSRFYPGFIDSHTWNVNLQAGTARGVLPELESFRIGGNNGLRGYEPGAFSGRDILLVSLEYSINIVENFDAVIFTDIGNAWSDKESIAMDDLHYSFGIGIRYNSPLGLIKLDYGLNEDGEGMPHFGIGTSF